LTKIPSGVIIPTNSKKEKKMLVALTPESLDIANAYLTYGDARTTAQELGLAEYQVFQLLERKDVKDYITGVYLDRGYRNRSKLGQVLDKMIDSKIEEVQESGIYTSKDLLDLLQFAHKMRMDELKSEQATAPTVNIANFGQGNYGMLMEKLLNNDKGSD
jgi:hypothetical protein